MQRDPIRETLIKVLVVFSLASFGVDLPTPGVTEVALSLASARAAHAAVDGTDHGFVECGPVVRAVVFWANGCPHCHEVIARVLPRIAGGYGASFDLRLIEIRTAADVECFFRTAAAFGFRKGEVGVPFLVIGDRALVGSAQIAAELPAVIERYLALGGVDFPGLPDLDYLRAALPSGAPIGEGPARRAPTTEARASQPTRRAPEPPAAVPGPPSAQPQPRPIGFNVALLVLAGMSAALIYAGRSALLVIRYRGSGPTPATPGLVIPILALAGLAVAGYLAYVETQGILAVCGPVGDCNAVQSSPYARLFGVLPVGVLGAIGYVAILAAWLWRRFGTGRQARGAPAMILGMAVFGVGFSLYLTYLEAFVIGAVCAWCLASAGIITLVMLFSLGPGLRVLIGPGVGVGPRAYGSAPKAAGRTRNA